MQSRIYWVVLAILLGQMAMAVTVYTGLRFNAIYGITLLACFYSFKSRIYL